MNIPVVNFKQIVSNFLRIIDREKISSLSDLEKRLNQRVQLSETEEIRIELTSSNFNTRATTISYIIQNMGIPVEAKINKVLGYSKIIIKLGDELQGYVPFGIDVFGNIAQCKDLPTTDFSEIRKELEYLL